MTRTTKLQGSVGSSNLLIDLFEEMARQWHPSKNEDVQLESVEASSAIPVWWRCDRGHDWQSSALQRTTTGAVCPWCAGIARTQEELKLDNSLLARRPELALEWHPTKNDGLLPQNVSWGSAKKVWWQCSSNSQHVWQARIDSRSAGAGCPFCSGLRVDQTNSLASLRPDIAGEWHPQKNQGLLPSQVTCGSKKKVWWQCGRDESHQWQATIKDRTAGGGCPSCMVKGRPVTDKNRLSLLYPELASEWHPTKNRMLWPPGRKATRYEQQGLRLPVDERPKRNRRLRPSDVSIGSTEYVWWQCKKNHVWYAMISTRTYMKAGCPVCSGLKVSSETSLLAKYPGVSKQWHPTRNLPLEPGQVSAGSDKKVWWRCLISRSRLASGSA